MTKMTKRNFYKYTLYTKYIVCDIDIWKELLYNDEKCAKGKEDRRKIICLGKGRHMKRKKWMRKSVSMAIAVIMALQIPGTVLAEDNASQTGTSSKAVETGGLPQSDGNKLRLWYTTPGSESTWTNTGLVIGNGKTGGILFGQVGKDQIHFNEKTLWNGGPSESRPNYNGGNRKNAVTEQQLEEIRQSADNHSSSVFPLGTGGLNNVMGDGDGMGNYQDFGDLFLDFSQSGMTNENVTNYVRDLDMRTAISSLHYDYEGVHYAREYFATHKDGVMVIHLTASEKGKLSFTASAKSAAGLKTTVTADKGRITLSGQVNDNQMKCEMQAQIEKKGGNLKTNADGTVTVEQADEVTIVLSTGTNYKNEYPTYRGEDPHKGLTAAIDAAAKQSYEQLKERHLEDYQQLFNRVELDLGGECPQLPTDQMMKNYRAGTYDLAVEEMIYQFGRYLTIAGSREGDPLPTNLCGIWMIGSAGPFWGADFHFNVNVQMNYWPAYSTNLAECGTVFNDFMESLVEPGRVTAGQSCALPTEVGTPIGEGNGFLVHTQNNPFGCTAPFGSQEYGWNIGGSSWALQNVYDYYLYTGDTEYLRTKIYPMLKEMANFWNQFLWYSEYQKRLVVGPSVSAEQGPTVNGTTYDQSIVWELYKMAIEASEILNVDKTEREVWKEKQAQLNPIIIGKEGQVKEWYEETTLGKGQAGELPETNIPNFGAGGGANQGAVHRHTSQLIGLFPGTLINKDNEEWMNAAIKSLEQRSLNGTGWSKAMKINMYARTGLAEETYAMVRGMCAGNQNGILDNLLDSHPPFQIDGNYGLTAGMTEMLLQSQLGYTQFLPALPETWEKGSVSGIKSRGNFTIGEAWSNGLAEEFTVCYEGADAKKTFTGEYEGITNAKVFADGKAVSVTKDEQKGQISFEAEKGKTYTIDMTGVNNSKLIEKAKAFLEKIHPDLVLVKEELQNAIDETDPKLGEVLEKAKSMDQIYNRYLKDADKIYYMTTEEGLSPDNIDSMYCTMRNLRKALLENTQDLAWYQEASTQLQEISSILNQQMQNRVISFSKESGTIKPGDTTLRLSKNAAAKNYDIRYTLDGSEPNAESALYETSIELKADQSTTVRTALFLDEQRVSPVYTKQYAGRIPIQSVTASCGNWDGYVPESMIDGKTDTRWASKDVTNVPVEIELQFESETTVNRIYFEQFVSGHNGVDDFEIQAMVNGKYEKIYEGNDLGDGSDDVGGNRAYKTVEFPEVSTSAMKVIFKKYQEPSFYEVQPMLLREVEDTTGNPESLNAVIALAESADRSSEEYVNASENLKNSFEESIVDGKEAVSLTQAGMDSREEFIRTRYNRLGYGETDKSELERLIAQGEEAAQGSYTRDSLYYLKKQMDTAKVVYEDSSARQPAVDRMAEALRNALNQLVPATTTTVVPPTELEGNSGWEHVGAYMATDKDNAGILTYSFTGSAIQVPTIKAQDHGVIRVQITGQDGESVYNETIDTYHTERVEGVPLMEAEFAEGTYTITFERIGKSEHGQDKRGWVEVGNLTISSKVTETVDRSELEAEMDLCKELQEEDYTSESWSAFQVVLKKANEVYKKEDAQTCTAEMKEMSADLKKAREALIERVKVDTSELERVLEEAKKISSDGYTEESYENLRQGILEVESFLQGDSYNQDEVYAKTAMLRQRMEALQADKTALQEKYDEISGLKQGNVTDESWKAFLNLKSETEVVLKDEKATPAQVSSILKKLEEFQFEYKEPTDIPSKPGTGGNTGSAGGNTNTPNKNNGAVQTGDTANTIWFAVIVAAGFLIAGNLYFKKRRNN